MTAPAQVSVPVPCIRCGHCADICPAGLLPLQLLGDIQGEHLSLARSHGLLDCTECGRCDPVCPSRIPLLAIFQDGKRALLIEESATASADAARSRYLARQQRLASEQGERRERHAAQTANASSPDAVAAAIERANARRRARLDDPSR